MKIRVQSVHFTADQKLLDFIQKKADKTDTETPKIKKVKSFKEVVVEPVEDVVIPETKKPRAKKSNPKI